MNDLAGPVALALVGLWVAYLVPGKLRHRQQLLESRVDDRYSEALRVVAVTAGDAGADDRRSTRVLRTVRATGPGARHAGTRRLLTPGKGVPALVAGAGTGGRTVDRPHATPERTTADAARRAAQARAARTAASARRAAAARRRGVLAGLFVALTVAGWAAVATVPGATVMLGAVPSVLLVSVLSLGRRAVVAGRHADEALAQQIAQQDAIATAPHSGATRAVAAARRAGVPVPEATVVAPPVSRQARSTAENPAVTGRAVKPSDTSTQMFEKIVSDWGENGPSVRHSALAPRTSQTDEDEKWAPIPVPPPTYTLKAPAPRREPVALTDVEASTAVRPTEVTPAADEEIRTPVAPVQTTGSINLNDVLAKRRASGQ